MKWNKKVSKYLATKLIEWIKENVDMDSYGWTMAGKFKVEGVTSVYSASGEELWDSDASVFTSGIYSWYVYPNNTIANVGNELEITYVDDQYGAQITLRSTNDLYSDLVYGAMYELSIDAYYSGVSAGTLIKLYDGTSYLDVGTVTASKTTHTFQFTCLAAIGCIIYFEGMTTGNKLYIDNLSLKRVYLQPAWTSEDADKRRIVYASDTNKFFLGLASGWQEIEFTGHSPEHIKYGEDEIDGDLLDIDYVPSNYTRNSTSIGYGWDVSTAVYSQELDVTAQDASVMGLFFKSDGTKMYIVGNSDDSIYEYDLSVPWIITSAVYSQLFDVGTEEIVPVGVFFNTTGTKMYVPGYIGDDVNEYNLSVAWDITSAVYSTNTSIANNPSDIFFKPDGTKMYVSDSDGGEISEYDLSIAWDISTAVYSQEFSHSTNTARAIFFNTTGTKMYVLDGVGDNEVYEYNLTNTPITLNTESLTSHLQGIDTVLGTKADTSHGDEHV